MVTFILLIYIVSFFLSPFPYWKTYILLWKTLFFDKNKSISRESRIKQSIFLVKYVLFCPLWTLLWYLDELIYSSYKQQEVRPIFIIGQPRCGTTFLHRALAADEDNYVAIRHIEWRYPYITFQKFLNGSGLIKRILQKNYWPDTKAGRVAAKMHPNSLSDWEEDGIFFEERFLHHFFIFFRFPYPHLLEYLDGFDSLPESVQQHVLETHRKVIQKVMFLHQGSDKFYLSKEVTSHNKIPFLLKVYPDAKFIVIVRRTTDFMNSLIALVRFSTKSKTGVDPTNIPGWEKVFIQRMRKDCLMLKNVCQNHIKSSNQKIITFNLLVKNIELSIEHIYKYLGLKINSDYRNYIKKISNDQKKRDRGYDYQQKIYQGFEEFEDFLRRVDIGFACEFDFESKN